MKIKIRIVLIVLLLNGIFLSSCKKDEQPGGNQLPDDIRIVNEFIYNNTIELYLWNEYIPAGININDYPDPYDLFEAMYYPTLDHWSFVTDDFQGILDELNGIQITEGYILKLYRYPTGDNIFAWVEYVYEGGPAANAGVKRGNLILSVNGQTLNINNYQTLLPLEVKEIGLGEIVNDQITVLGVTKIITQIELTINPVLQYSVIEKSGKRIGYFLYDQFTNDVTVLEDVMTYFKSQNITDLVLDLRYNPGGYVTTLDSLAGMIAPSAVIGNTFLTQQYNSILTDFLVQEYGSQSEVFITKFPITPVNLNLSKLYVLTSWRSASASESLVNGLNPYMDVVLIGEKTAGKYTGGWFLDDTQHSENKWGLYIMTSKVANAIGETDFVDGLNPDYLIYDDYITPLGDESEPLFAQAISLITAIPIKKSTMAVSGFASLGYWYSSKLKKDGIMVAENKFLK